MSTKAYVAGDNEVQKLWSKRVQTEALLNTQIGKFLGEDDKSLGVIETSTSKDAGDRVTTNLRMRLVGAGVTETMPLEGNEEALTTYTDQITINELGHAVRRKKGISDQRIPWDVGQQNNDALIDWWAERLDRWAFNHLCGYTPQTDTRYTGFNATTAPTSGRGLWCSSSHTTDATLDSSDLFSLAHIDRAREIATTGSSAGLPRIRPIKAEMADGGYGDMYVCFIHPTQTTQLRASSSAWTTIQNNLLQGGYVKENPLFTGAIGVYNKTIIHESEFVTPGVSAGAAVSNTRRAVFCGAQALTLAFGKGFSATQAKITEQAFDYDREAGQSLVVLGGMKKSVFNSTDYGTIVLASYAADAA